MKERDPTAKMKEKIRKEYYLRIRLVLKSELNVANRIDAINSLAVPVVTYMFQHHKLENGRTYEIRQKNKEVLDDGKNAPPKS